MSWKLPEATSASRSRRLWSRPHTSTAETRMEKRVPVLSLRSSARRKSQEMAQGTTPRLWGELSFPIMVYDLPGGHGACEGSPWCHMSPRHPASPARTTPNPARGPWRGLCLLHRPQHPLHEIPCAHKDNHPPSPPKARAQQWGWQDGVTRVLTKARVAKGKNAAISPTNHRLEHVSHSARADLSLGRNQGSAGQGGVAPTTSASRASPRPVCPCHPQPASPQAGTRRTAHEYMTHARFGGRTRVHTMTHMCAHTLCNTPVHTPITHMGTHIP